MSTTLCPTHQSEMKDSKRGHLDRTQKTFKYLSKHFISTLLHYQCDQKFRRGQMDGLQSQCPGFQSSTPVVIFTLVLKCPQGKGGPGARVAPAVLESGSCVFICFICPVV